MQCVILWSTINVRLLKVFVLPLTSSNGTLQREIFIRGTVPLIKNSLCITTRSWPDSIEKKINYTIAKNTRVSGLPPPQLVGLWHFHTWTKLWIKVTAYSTGWTIQKSPFNKSVCVCVCVFDRGFCWHFYTVCPLLTTQKMLDLYSSDKTAGCWALSLNTLCNKFLSGLVFIRDCIRTGELLKSPVNDLER